MKIPIETKPALWGAAGGAAAMAFVGFTWGGWVTAGKAETMVQTRVSEAVVGALAPVCAERFRHTGGAPANLVELKKVAAWSQGEFVERAAGRKARDQTRPSK